MTKNEQEKKPTEAKPTARRLVRPLVLGFGLAAVAVSVFWLSGRYLLLKDNLLHLAPTETATYLHLNLTSDALRQAVPGLPDTAQPDEAARFTVQKDGHTQTAWLIGWFRRPVSEAEAASMDKLESAWRSWDNIWLIGDQGLQENLSNAVQQQNGLNSDPLVIRALAAARSLAPVQFYLNPAGLAANSAGASGDWLKQLPPLVGSSLTLDAELTHLYPLDRTKGPARFPVTVSHNPPKRSLTSVSGASFAGPSQAIDWVPLIFSRINRWRLATGLDPVSLPTPEEIHRGPVTVSVDRISSTHELGVMVQMDGAKPEDVANRVSQYLDRVLPTRTVTVLPDNDQVTELILRPGNNSFRLTDESGARFLWNRPADLKLYLKPTKDGAALSTAPIEDTISELNIGQCAGIGGDRLIIEEKYLDGLWKTLGLTGSQQSQLRLFIENRPNLWISCRVIHTDVDNLKSN
jgi:hypothetical protein